MLIWTGTAAVENGSATVVVDTGAALTAEVVAQGAMVVLDGIVYFADSLTDTTTLELTRGYAGDDGDVPMEIWPVSQNTTNLVNLAQTVARTQAQINVLDKNSQGLFFYMKGVTGAGDPGAGFIAFDDADPAQVTEAYVDALDANGRAVSELVALWEAGTTLVVRSITTTAYRAYTVATNTAESGYTSLALTYIGHDGVLADNEALSLSWSRAAAGLEISASGNFADRDDYDDAPAGFVFLSADGDGGAIAVSALFRKNSADEGDWGPPVPFQGPQGDRGWSPVLGLANDGTRRVLRLTDYVGGEGPKPTAGVGQYLTAGGLTSNIGAAMDVRGTQGLSAYAVAVASGFVGTEAAWLASLVGASAYQVAVANGFAGDQAAWLASLNGADGTDPGALFNWDDGTADADPGAGNMRADRTDLSEAAFLYVSKTGRTGDDLSVFLASIGSSTNLVKGHVTLTSTGGHAQAIVRVISLTDDVGYVKIGLQAGTHSGASGFVDDTPISLQFSLAGNQGAADEISMASAINSSPEVSNPAADTKFAITDPDNGDLLSWISFTSLSNAIKPRALVAGKAANYVVIAEDAGKNLDVSAAAAARTVTLPPASEVGNGFEVGIRKADSSVNTVTIDGDGSETINGMATLVLRHLGDSVRLVSSGSTWLIGSSSSTDRAALLALSRAANKVAYWDSPTTMALADFNASGRELLSASSDEELRSAIGFGSRQINYATAGTYVLDADDFSPGAIHRVYGAGTVQIDVSALTFNHWYDFVTWETSTLVLDSSGGADRFVGYGMLNTGLVTSVTIRPNQTCRIMKVAGGRIMVDYFPVADGNWTPTVSFATPGNLNIAYSTRAGRYQLSGKTCKLWLSVTTSTFTHTTASGALTITGLPFPAAANGVFYEGPLGYTGINNATRPSLNLMLAAGGNELNVQAHGPGASIVSVQASDMPTGGLVVLRGAIQYEVG